ncbi:MAG TPA: DUF6632 domain-containing protein [Aeromicrobium sp.]|nr:DUF6632 domain-containing protein [Aeromicrobium sp.]
MDATRSVSTALRVVGAIFVVFFVFAFVASATKMTDPDLLYRMLGWGSPGDAEEQMLSIIYIFWGVFLWRAAKDPFKNGLFIDFTIAANVAHFALMAVQSLVMPGEHTHLYGDVLVGFIVIAILAVPWFAVRGAQRTPA